MLLGVTYLILREGRGVLQIQGSRVRWWISGCHGKATQGVTTWTPLSYCAQELFPKVRGQGHPCPTINPDPTATLQNTLWCPLWLTERREERCAKSTGNEQGSHIKNKLDPIAVLWCIFLSPSSTLLWTKLGKLRKLKYGLSKKQF